MSQMNGLHGMWGRFTCSETSGIPQVNHVPFTYGPLKLGIQGSHQGRQG